jgi:hypothetical protein
MNTRGHNENALRLGALAKERLKAADVERLNGWLRFGELMLEAASLCGDKRTFDRWLRGQVFQVGDRPVSAAERQAAIWGAQNPDAFRHTFLAGRGMTPQAAMKRALRAARPDRRDFVYVMTNPSMPGMAKVGMTKVSPQARASQISQNTGIPTPFEVFAEFRTSQADRVEAAAHEAMKAARVSASREFFAVTPEAACSAIKAAMQEMGQ